MCRYSYHNYRDHFACFDCRKSFKYWQWHEIDVDYFTQAQRLQHVPREIICPECSKPMVDMGLDFKAPPKCDEVSWAILNALRLHGFTFFGCGCHVGFSPPRTLREVPDWIEQHRRHSEGELLLKRFEEKKSMTS